VAVEEVKPDHQLDGETNAWRWLSLAEAMELETMPNTREFLLDAQKLIEREKLLDYIST
jgi:hypothetical protein